MITVPNMAPELREALIPAYAPCPAFAGGCSSMRWDPARGHVPRGFCGATGNVHDVGLVMVVAEPGDPHDHESHQGTPGSILDSAYSYAHDSFSNGRDAFHKNVRTVMDLCWPGLSYDEQMRRTWITESVLCSADRECGPVPPAVERECRKRYLERQLALLSPALVVAFGLKARQRMRGIRDFHSASAVAPPGANRRAARDSWAEIAAFVRTKFA